VRTALAPLPTAAQNGSAVFSAACFHHCVTQETTFWGIKVYNVSFRDLAGAWYFQKRAPLKYVEACDGFKCGTCRTHRKNPGAPPDPRPKPPRAPSPPDPFAVWSPPPKGMLMHPPPPPMRIAGGVQAQESAGEQHRHVAAGVLVLLGLAAGIWFCLARRGRRLRVMHGERSLELEEDALIGGAARRAGGGGGGGGYGAAGGGGAPAPGDAAAALAAFRADARYATPGSVGGARAPLRGVGSGTAPYYARG
jgi:hypothetical protein